MHSLRVRRASCRLFVVWICSFLALPFSAHAVRGRLVSPPGTAVGGCDVAVVGRSGSVRSDAAGIFRLEPDPQVPFTLVVSTAAGEVFAPVTVSAIPAEGELVVELAAVVRDSITVVAGVAPSIDSPPAAALSTLSREDLEQRRPEGLVDTLEAVPGTSRIEDGRSGVPVVRGLARGRTLILVDGARISAERRAGPSGTFLNPFSFGAVDISRGPGSVAYGSDAFGGVVAVKPRDPERGRPALRYDLGGSTGAVAEIGAGVEGSVDLGGGALLGQIYLRDAADQESGGGATIRNSAWSDGGAALRWVRDLAAGRLRLGLAFDRGEEIGKPAADSGVTRAFYPLEDSRRFTAGFESTQLGTWEKVEANFGLGRYRLVLDRDRVPTATVTRQVDRSDVSAADASLRLVGTRVMGGGRLQLGLDAASRFGLEAVVSQRRFDTAGTEIAEQRFASIDEATRLDSGVFAVWDRTFGRVVALSAGARGDGVQARNRAGYFGDRSRTDRDLSGHLALTFGPWKGATATMQASRGFRSPSLSDRYFRGPSGRGFVVGNPDLEPEHSRQLDLAVRWSGAGRSLGLFGYDYRILDLIERFRAGTDFRFRNRGEAQIRGLELEAQQELPRGFSLQLGAAWARGEDATSGAAIDDIAALNGAATVRWASVKGFAYLRLSAFARDERPGPNEVVRPGYALVDLGASWRFHPLLELRVLVRNLGDRRYHGLADAAADLSAGRSVMIGLTGRH